MQVVLIAVSEWVGTRACAFDQQSLTAWITSPYRISPFLYSVSLAAYHHALIVCHHIFVVYHHAFTVHCRDSTPPENFVTSSMPTAATSTNTATSSCDSSCSDSSDPWTGKCTWLKCAACQQCSASLSMRTKSVLLLA